MYGVVYYLSFENVTNSLGLQYNVGTSHAYSTYEFNRYCKVTVL